jgi:hypothetical protein
LFLFSKYKGDNSFLKHIDLLILRYLFLGANNNNNNNNPIIGIDSIPHLPWPNPMV